MAAVSSGIEVALPGDAVDRDQGPVQQHTGQSPDSMSDLADVFGQRREQSQGVVDVAPSGTGRDLDPGRETGAGVTVA